MTEGWDQMRQDLQTLNQVRAYQVPDLVTGQSNSMRVFTAPGQSNMPLWTDGENTPEPVRIEPATTGETQAGADVWDLPASVQLLPRADRESLIRTADQLGVLPQDRTRFIEALVDLGQMSTTASEALTDMGLAADVAANSVRGFARLAGSPREELLFRLNEVQAGRHPGRPLHWRGL